MSGNNEDEQYIKDFIRKHNGKYGKFLLITHDEMKELAQQILPHFGYEIVEVEKGNGWRCIDFEGIHPDLVVRDKDTKEEIAVEVGNLNSIEEKIKYFKRGRNLIWIPYPDFGYAPLFSIFVIKNKNIDTDAIEYLNERINVLEKKLSELRESRIERLELIHEQLNKILYDIRKDLRHGG